MTDSTSEVVAGVLLNHATIAFSPVGTACVCDRTWREHDKHRAHVADAIAAALGERAADLETAWEQGAFAGRDYQKQLSRWDTVVCPPVHAPNPYARAVPHGE